MFSSWLPRRPLLAAALCAGLTAPALPAPVAAQTPLVGRAWQLFEWFSGAGPIEGDGFLLTATQRTGVRVTDLGASGSGSS